MIPPTTGTRSHHNYGRGRFYEPLINPKQHAHPIDSQRRTSSIEYIIKLESHSQKQLKMKRPGNSFSQAIDGTQGSWVEADLRESLGQILCQHGPIISENLCSCKSRKKIQKAASNEKG